MTANTVGKFFTNNCYAPAFAVVCKCNGKIHSARLKLIAKIPIEPYQCGYMHIKSTVDQIFILLHIPEKIHDNKVDSHHPFVDYKTVLGSRIKDRIFAAMSELSIAAKLIILHRTTLSSTIKFKHKLEYTSPNRLIP